MDFVESYLDMCSLTILVSKDGLKYAYYSIVSKVFDSIDNNFQEKNRTVQKGTWTYLVVVASMFLFKKLEKMVQLIHFIPYMWLAI